MPDITIYKVDTNPSLVDVGAIWEGDNQSELHMVTRVIKEKYDNLNSL
jgi:hypothetical protein